MVYIFFISIRKTRSSWFKGYILIIILLVFIWICIAITRKSFKTYKFGQSIFCLWVYWIYSNSVLYCVYLPAKMLLKIDTVWPSLKLLASLMRNNFPERPSRAQLHTLSNLYNVPVGCLDPLLILGSVLLYLRSPKCSCCSISEDLSCSS